jgi:hypothetical protein
MYCILNIYSWFSIQKIPDSEITDKLNLLSVNNHFFKVKLNKFN